jgi:hypothetical protein
MAFTFFSLLLVLAKNKKTAQEDNKTARHVQKHLIWRFGIVNVKQKCEHEEEEATKYELSILAHKHQ